MVSVRPRLRDTVASTKPVRITGGAKSPQRSPMTTPRLFNRYGHNPNHSTRTCSTPGCSREAKEISGQCWVCGNNKRRFGHPLQDAPLDSTLAPFIRRAETQRARHQHLDVAALEARWQTVVDGCRGSAEPSFREKGKLSFNIHDREGSALVRDIAEADGMTFIRALDLMTALHLMQIERPHAFRSEDAFKAVTVETFRKAANVGLMFAPLRPGANRQQGYRKALSLPSRLATARYLQLSLGGAAEALAKREAKRADQERETRASYYAVVNSIAAE
jgi:hypothetical protein